MNSTSDRLGPTPTLRLGANRRSPLNLHRLDESDGGAFRDAAVRRVTIYRDDNRRVSLSFLTRSFGLVVAP